MISDAFKDRARDPTAEWSEMGREVKVLRKRWERVSSFVLVHRRWENCTCWVGRNRPISPSAVGWVGDTGGRGFLHQGLHN